jgi:hypothetical protein
MPNTKATGVAYSDPALDGAVIGASGGTVGFYGTTPVTKPAALTTQLTTITIADAAGTPDYALQALTTSSPYGLATAAEAITLLYVIQNLQTRMAEMETKVRALGLVT